MDLGLKRKVALITGASKGLGLAIAAELAKEGVHVSICARGQKDLDAAAAALRKTGVSVVATSADVTVNYLIYTVASALAVSETNQSRRRQ